VPDAPHQSAIFTIAVIASLMGVCALLFSHHTYIRATLFDKIALSAFIYILLIHPPTASSLLEHLSIYLIYIFIRKTEQPQKQILYYIILLSLISLSLWGYLQYSGVLASNHPHFNITGPYGNPNIYAGMLSILMIVPLTYILSYKKRYLHKRLFSFTTACLIIAIPILYLTHCRSAWIAIVFTPIYVFRKDLGKIRKDIIAKNRILWIATITTTIISTILIGYTTFELKPNSVRGRFLIWKVTAQMIKEKPIIGFGEQGFAANYMLFQANYLKETNHKVDKRVADNNRYVYNEPLRWTVEYGICGLLLYIGIAYFILSYKQRDITSRVYQSVLIAGMIIGQFSYITFPLLVIMAIAFAEMSNQLSSKNILPHRTWHNPLMVNASLLMVLCYQSLLWAGAYKAYSHLYSITHPIANIRSEKFIYELNSLEKRMSGAIDFWTFYGNVLNALHKDSMLLDATRQWESACPNSNTYILKGDAYLRLGNFEEAEKAYWTAHYMAPSHQKARCRLASLYYKSGKVLEAQALAEQVLSENVKVHSFETYELHRELQILLKHMQ
jgi:O-antigen ligase